MIDVIIPTFDNRQYLEPCLASLMRDQASFGLMRVFVVNNGAPASCDWIQNERVSVLQTGGANLGWTAGLQFALGRTISPFVLFLNDDTFIPPASSGWLPRLLQHFDDAAVGAVGPGTNVVMGLQNIFTWPPEDIFNSTFLIGFCMLLRRSALDQAGGVDDRLPGGDDFDLSIRLRAAGFRLIVDRTVFVFHHGFKTGQRVYGPSSSAGGWNSQEFKDRTDVALLRKHGVRAWKETIRGALYPLLDEEPRRHDEVDEKR